MAGKRSRVTPESQLGHGTEQTFRDRGHAASCITLPIVGASDWIRGMGSGGGFRSTGADD